MNTKICPQCQSPIPANAPGGLCPACVLRDADEPSSVGRGAPSLAEIAAAFPQLEVLRLVGQGGMGFVYQARQPSLDRTVALKILAPELGRDPAFAERFAREARVLGKLSHPNIVTVFEHGQSGGFFYLLMEYVDGVNLRQAMRAGRFTPQQALAVVPGICDALQAAHAQGIWHRDIKPENILLDARGGVKIADFGIARIVGDPARDFTLTVTGGALGSAVYMAPEQHEKPHDVDHRADIFSLGVVIYEMLTGELPLGRFPAPSERATVSARIDEIVFQTLEKERELRQQSATEVKTDVSRAARSGETNEPTRAIPEQRGSGISKIALVAGVVLFGAAVIFTRGSTQGVMLTLATTLFALGALGLALGKGASRNLPRVASGQPARITVRSLALILGGVIALAVCATLYTVRNSKAAIQREARRAREVMILTQQKAKLEAEAKARQTGRNSGTRVIKPIPASTTEPERTSVPSPAVPATDVFREMNAFANASNGDEFRKRVSVSSYPTGPIAPYMQPFFGRVKMLKDLGELEKPAIPDHDIQPKRTLFAAIEKSNGSTNYLQVLFTNEQGAWRYQGISAPLYRARCRVEFRPATGDAFTILRAHLGENVAQPVVGAEGQFDFSALDVEPAEAVRKVENNTQYLSDSLKNVDLDGALKIIARPELPTLPMHAEEAPVEKSKP